MAKSMGRKPAAKKTTTPELKYLCHHCLKEKKKSDFYISTDPNILTGITYLCKDCVKKIARNWDENRQEYGQCNKKSVMTALEYIDKPFLNSLWDASYHEVYNTNKHGIKESIWDAYIKNVGMKQYRTMRWRDGDIFNTYVEDAKQVAIIEERDNTPSTGGAELDGEFEKNKKDVIRLLGYDPFEFEKLEDQPLLYSQLIGYLDLGGDNEDMMRTSSAISIVRGFLQQAKLDDKITKVMLNSTVNPSEIKTLLDAKQKVSSTISQLAEQSCLSLKHNKNASKGENTFTGKTKKLKEINLREAENNAFDIGTCEGMRQVADISNASILKQIHLDENDYTEMLAQQREMIMKLQEQAELNAEKARILLRENVDLKQFIAENNLDISEHLKAQPVLQDSVINEHEGSDVIE